MILLKEAVTMPEKCPVCGETEVYDFQTCTNCGWGNDIVQHRFPDMKDGDNTMSLNEARQAYKEGREIY